MTQDLGWLLVDGYCYSHRKGGPFTIGEDFEAPGPAGRILPRIRIEQNTWDELWSFIANGTDTNSSENSDAEIFGDVTKRIEFENSVSEALSWYVSDCQFQAEIPAFRKELQGLRKTIEQFQSDVPDEFSSLGHFLYKTYTGEAFLRDRLKPSNRQLLALQDSWRERTGFLALQDTLNMMLRNIEAAESMIGNRKPRQHQIKAFVEVLHRHGKKQQERGRRAVAIRSRAISLVGLPISFARRTTFSPSPFEFLPLIGQSGQRVKPQIAPRTL